MKAILLAFGLFTLSLTTGPAVAGSCGGGDHTHTTEDSSTKKEKTGI